MRCEIRAALVQVFDTNPFYEICPECGTRVKEIQNSFSCEEHGEVEPSYIIIVSGVLDDGTGNMRAVFFRENAEKIIGMTAKEARAAFMKKMERAAIFGKVE